MLKVGFLCGVGGNRSGLGEYLQTLANAGERIVLGSYDDWGVIAQALAIQGDAVTFFRPTVYPNENPDYSLSGQAAGQAYWELIERGLPTEFDRRAWIIWGNEGRREAEWGNWWGEVALEITTRALARGYKTLAFGWAWGTPEPEVWDAPAMREFLKLCAANRDMVGIAVHEGSDPRTGSLSPLIADVPWGSGRFVRIFEVADSMGIPRPTIAVTECAWLYNDCPEVGEGLGHIAEANEFYAQFPSVLGVTLWYLGGGVTWGQLPDKLARYIPRLPEIAMGAGTPPSPQPPPDPDRENDLAATLLAEGNFHQLIRLNPTAALQKAIVAAGMQITSGEFDVAINGVSYRCQRAERFDRGGGVVFYARIGDWGNIRRTDEAAQWKWLPLPLPLASGWRITGRLGDQRSYGKHEGVDFAAPSGTPVRLGYDAVVIDVGFDSQWRGNFIHCQLVGAPEAINVRLLHLLALPTWKRGQKIPAGALVGQVGSTGNSTGPHLHITTTWPGHGLGGFGVPDVIDPLSIIDLSRDTQPLAVGVAYDVYEYMRAGVSASKPYGTLFEVRSPSGAQQRHQCQFWDGRTYQVKDGDAEEFWADQDFVYRWRDTSPGGGMQYKLEDTPGKPGSRWAPRTMRVGDVFVRRPVVIWQNIDTCQDVGQQQEVESAIKLAAHHSTWPGGAGGQAISDVIELWWLADGAATAPIERYFYGLGLGLVGWATGLAEPASVSEVHHPGTRPNNQRGKMC